MDHSKIADKERKERLLQVVRHVRSGQFEIRPLTLAPHMPPLPSVAEASLRAYALTGQPTGGFLDRVLANDLIGSVIKADLENLRCLPAIAAFMYERLPRECWGSKRHVDEWLNAHDAVRTEENTELTNPEIPAVHPTTGDKTSGGVGPGGKPV